MKATLYIALGLLGVLALADPALAAEAKPAWRAWWDLAWRVVNFLVLAIIIVKFAKQPLKDFLTGKRAALSAELDEVEKAKNEAQAEMDRIKRMTANLAEELEEFQKALEQRAAGERQQMLETAKDEAERIIERAGLQAEMAVENARRQLAEEIVELAGQIAAEKIGQAMNSQDQARMLDQFAKSVAGAKAAS